MRAGLALVAVALVAALAPSASAEAGRIAVGLLPGSSADELALAIETVAGVPVDRSLEPIGALVVEVTDVDAVRFALAAVPGVEYVEPLTQERRLLFQPNDPLAQGGPTQPAIQWYLSFIRAFDFWSEAPALPNPVRVAVIDSGIDGSHPDLQGKVVAGRSFVPGRWDVDRVGHGTIVAGEIAATTDNSLGIAGVGLPVELVVAKVVKGAGGAASIDVEDEAKAIQWAVGVAKAKVVNLSLGGVRDPRDPRRDQYSEVEQAAIEYAYGHGAVVVAATGNTELGGCRSYPYASYPAALPHVVGVGAVAADAGVACFSNRDGRYNDLVAPGVGIVSTYPTGISDPACATPGYSLTGCAPGAPFSGTSFAAPLVSAAAALAISVGLGQGLDLAPSQVMQLLQATTADRPADGRNAAYGNGLLDVSSALATLAAGALPPPDRYETNDDAGQDAWVVPGARPTVGATIDWYEDPNDVYRVYLRQGRRVVIRVKGLQAKATLVLWRPGTATVTDVTQVAVRAGKIVTFDTARAPVLRVTVPRSGWYFVELKAAAQTGYQPYLLTVRSTR